MCPNIQGKYGIPCPLTDLLDGVESTNREHDYVDLIQKTSDFLSIYFTVIKISLR